MKGFNKAISPLFQAFYKWKIDGLNRSFKLLGADDGRGV